MLFVNVTMIMFPVTLLVCFNTCYTGREATSLLLLYPLYLTLMRLGDFFQEKFSLKSKCHTHKLGQKRARNRVALTWYGRLPNTKHFIKNHALEFWLETRASDAIII